MRSTTTVVVAMVSNVLFGEIANADMDIPTVPQSIDGWALSGGPQVYGRETLFDYINGGAELYLAYSFQRLFAFTYSVEGKPHIVVDLFDMGRSEDAFGVFCAEREGPDVEIGQGSEYDSGLLRFWKGRFFVSILAHGELPGLAEVIQSLGAAIAEGIQETGHIPDLVKFLPPEGLKLESVKYFRSHHLLNMYYYLASENILGLSRDTNAVLARYEKDDGRPYLLLVCYPSPVHAEWARGHFKDVYMPDAHGYAVQTEDDNWTATALYQSLLAIVFEASSRLSAERLLKQVEEQGG